MEIDIQLKIRNYYKGIPYGPVQRDSFGSSNHGFKNVKGRPDEVETIPELQDSPAFKAAILAISEASTPFFTIGCESKLNHEGDVCWKRGFVEFAFNYTRLVADAQNYFKLFFDFNFEVFESNFDQPVYFSWELEGATFVEKKCDGFSVCVWITTKDLKDEAQTEETWNQAVLFLTQFLKKQPVFPLPMIYLPPASAGPRK